ncbi:MAG: GNAT family N-acetyltransferase [Gammaproteobacteria bacterium]|nr:GNAT family N-acetyltransferase [Gammaproteobacteria bacterium]
MRVLLNEIIHVGGTTAMEFPLSDEEFEDYFLCGPNFIYCNVATDSNNEVLGFQSLTRHPKLAEDWADIATFTRIKPKVHGVGTALFEETKLHAQRFKLEAINASIRADNIPGLSYYSKMGFVDYSVEKAMPLSDGTPVDRISRKYKVANC